MSMSFKYKQDRRGEKIIRTPSIPITLNGESEHVDTVVLIDSGADISVISMSMADLLGLKLENEEEVTGIGGKIKASHSNVSLKIEKGHESYSLRLPIKVLPKEIEIPVLLGRLVFFDSFDISFEQTKNKISLKKTTSFLVNR